MADVRKWIVDVRHPDDKWLERYRERAAEVVSALPAWRRTALQRLRKKAPMHEVQRAAETFDERMSAILTSPRTWVDAAGELTRPDPNDTILRAYTSDFGYEVLFRAVKSIFRTDRVPSESDQRISAFLIELVNIDLYNRAKRVGQPSFVGRVYRGLWARPADVLRFEELARQAKDKRSFSVPLALDSTSASEDIAMRFIEKAPPFADATPILLRIEVGGMTPAEVDYYQTNYVRLYRDRSKLHPTSVVSSICAVPIEEVSDHPEREVLLRGPFFDLLTIRTDDVRTHEGAPLMIVDVTTLNSNRDHPSAPQTQTNDATDPARDLFTRLVLRAKAALARRHCPAEEAASYDALVARRTNELLQFASDHHLPAPELV
jgi:hypothetical protein